jgi:hypothetical protein
MIKVMVGNGAGGVGLMTRTWRNYESWGEIKRKLMRMFGNVKIANCGHSHKQFLAEKASVKNQNFFRVTLLFLVGWPATLEGSV